MCHCSVLFFSFKFVSLFMCPLRCSLRAQSFSFSFPFYSVDHVRGEVWLTERMDISQN